MAGDKFLIVFGTLFCAKTRDYGRIDPALLPLPARRLLSAYKLVLIGISVVVALLLLRMKLWSLAFGVPLIIGGWVLKGHFEKRLDPLLAPFISNSRH